MQPYLLLRYRKGGDVTGFARRYAIPTLEIAGDLASKVFFEQVALGLGRIRLVRYHTVLLFAPAALLVLSSSARIGALVTTLSGDAFPNTSCKSCNADPIVALSKRSGLNCARPIRPSGLSIKAR